MKTKKMMVITEWWAVAIWLVFSPLFYNTLISASTDARDLEALMKVKAAIDPATIHTASCLSSWNFTVDPCDHKFSALFTCGFDCEPDLGGGIQRVTSLQLDSSGYRGFLSPYIGNLTLLRSLQISGNALEGSIPVTIGHLSQLTSLDLSSNLLTGSIPDSVGALHNLISVNLANNLLNNSIPVTLDSLVKLTELRINGNQLHGSLPDLSNLTLLQFMDLSNNALTGPLPLSLPPMVSSLSLKNNQLSGGLRSNFSTLQRLNVLDLDGNQLSGNIDSSLFAHPTLQQLNLSHNKFTMLGGCNSSEVLKSSQVVAIDLSYNMLKGSLPVYFASMAKLSSLSLSNNFFTGRIPLQYALETAANAGHIQRLLLDGNYLTGPVPAPFEKLIPGSIVATFGNNCLDNCPSKFFFCQGGQQKPASLCKLSKTNPE